ncbi:MAG: MarR family winged helix-turn-helix transcriptional regulator [Acutalibacteraceae bacterium]|nr:MarR family winged helix-turn-helix transcriptional regulator [Acutalibacteraceae bacterium]
MDCDFDNKTDIGIALRSINNLLMRASIQQSKNTGIDNCTFMHGWILGHLCLHKKDDVYQRDIEREFSLTRSAVTSIVKNMEQKGYIKRIEVEHDARLKKLVITSSGEKTHNKIVQSFQEMDKEIINHISDEDYKIFLKVCHQIKDNLHSLL